MHEGSWAVRLEAHGTAGVVKTRIPLTPFFSETVGAASRSSVLFQDQDTLTRLGQEIRAGDSTRTRA